MKKTIAFLLIVLLIGSAFPVVSLAAETVDSGSCGEGVTWTLDADGLLTIGGSGAMEDYNMELSSRGAPWATPAANAERVKNVVIENGVVSVGSEAFLSCKNLESVQLADSVVTIGTRAFSGCSSLRELTLNDGLDRIFGYAFFGCTALGSLSIPDSVTFIGASAFYGCAGLADVTIGRGLTSLGDSVFYGCSSLRRIEIPEGITAIRSYAFYGCIGLMDVTLPDSLASVGNRAFGGCSRLHILCDENTVARAYAEENGLAYGLLDGDDAQNAISGSDNGVDWRIDRKSCVLTIDVQGEMPAFQSAKDVPWAQGINKNYVHTAIVSPDAASIGALAFSGCDALTQVSVPAGVTSIGNYAFFGCLALQEIRLPDSVENVGAYAFSGCAALTDVSLGAGVKSIGAYAFADCASLAAIVIPNGVTVIRDYTFADCVRLAGAVLPNTLTSIGAVLPNTLTSIGAYAFARSGLTEAILPVSVRSVSNRAFDECASLFSVTFYSVRCTIGSDVMPAETRICGYAGSDAAAYAAENGMVFVEIGETHEHSFVVIRSVPASCERTGLITKRCSCGVQRFEVLPRTDLHIQGTAERTLITAPTCVDAGEERITVSCTVCGKMLLDDTYELPPTGAHTPGEPVETITLAPTCVTAGEKHLKILCTVCGQTMLDETYTISATGHHTPGETTETVLRPATCTEQGYKRVYTACTVCGVTTWETEVVIPKTEHRDDNGDRTCDICGAALGQVCGYCGRVHDDSFIGRLQQMMHNILYAIKRMFGNNLLRG